MRREVDQVAAVNKWNHFYASRQNTLIQLFDFRVDAGESVVRIRAFAQEHAPGDHIVVIDDFAVFATNGSSELAEADFRALCDDSDIFHAQRSTALGCNDDVLDIFYV